MLLLSSLFAVIVMLVFGFVVLAFVRCHCYACALLLLLLCLFLLLYAVSISVCSSYCDTFFCGCFCGCVGVAAGGRPREAPRHGKPALRDPGSEVRFAGERAVGGGRRRGADKLAPTTLPRPVRKNFAGRQHFVSDTRRNFPSDFVVIFLFERDVSEPILGRLHVSNP